MWRLHKISDQNSSCRRPPHLINASQAHSLLARLQALQGIYLRNRTTRLNTPSKSTKRSHANYEATMTNTVQYMCRAGTSSRMRIRILAGSMPPRFFGITLTAYSSSPRRALDHAIHCAERPLIGSNSTPLRYL